MGEQVQVMESKTGKTLPKPSWLRLRFPVGGDFEKVRSLVSDGRLHTVCQEAQCPNIWECFSNKTATFLILGSRCTRNCRFCAIEHGTGDPLEGDEPVRVAEAARRLNLKYVVVTSVTRDDLPDGGSSVFSDTIQAIHRLIHNVKVEVLIPDFKGSKRALMKVLEARPDVLNHNMETVRRLYPVVRSQADYDRSLQLIRRVGDSGLFIPSKSGLMLGLGETDLEIEDTLTELREAGCRALTLGQYLRPSLSHLPVARYITPDEFENWRQVALMMGFDDVASAPFVRSSYHADSIYNMISIK